MRCRRCNLVVTGDDAVYRDASNNRTSRPACRNCYEQLVRQAGEREARKRFKQNWHQYDLENNPQLAGMYYDREEGWHDDG